MRGADEPQRTLFSDVSVEDRIPADHPRAVGVQQESRALDRG